MIGYVRAAGWMAFVAAVLLLPVPARSAPRLALAIHAGYNEYDMTDVNQDLITHSINELSWEARASPSRRSTAASASARDSASTRRSASRSPWTTIV